MSRFSIPATARREASVSTEQSTAEPIVAEPVQTTELPQAERATPSRTEESRDAAPVGAETEGRPDFDLLADALLGTWKDIRLDARRRMLDPSLHYQEGLS